MLVRDIIDAIEAVAPRRLQEGWDNSGLQVGSAYSECSGVLVCVDVTPEVIDEAEKLGCNLVVSHHPLIFKGLKQLTGATIQQTAIMNAIAAGISVYSSHTAVDNAPGGVSYAMAAKLGFDVTRALSPLPGHLYKLQVMVPCSHAESVRMAIFDAGGGAMGNYTECSFNVDGTGTFCACEGSNPYAGVRGRQHHESEVAVQTIVPAHLRQRVEAAVLEVHPYECPAFEWIAIDNRDPMTGTGVVCEVPGGMTPMALAEHVKKTFGCRAVRCSDFEKALDADTKVLRVALCGGSGASFIGDAVAAHVQAYVTSDVKYHDFLDNASSLFLIDIGHFEAEECTKDIFCRIITRKFANFAVHKSAVETNPVHII